jgi:O-antigen/teichoic acid export membrane protein
MGLSVTGTYAMQALNLFRMVALISLGGRAVMLLLMVYLLHQNGLQGLATARACYGATALLVYLPLLFRPGLGKRQATPVPSMAAPCQLEEGSKP